MPRANPSAAQREFRLRVIQGPAVGAEFALTGPRIRIGRGDTNDIVLSDTNSSRNHAELVLEAGRYVVRDLGSRNGIYVNGKKVGKALLTEGDTIFVGGTGFQYFVLGAMAPRQARRAAAAGATNRRPLIYGIGAAVVAAIILMVVFGNKKPPAVTTDTGDLPTFGGSTMAGSDAGRNDPTTPEQIILQPIKNKKDAAGPKDPEERKRLVQEIFAEAQRAQEAGRLVDARAGFERALELDPSCRSCKARLERVSREIDQELQSAMDAGKRYLEFGNYDSAMTMFDRVMVLEPDPNNAYHQNAKRYLAEAKKKSKQLSPF